MIPGAAIDPGVPQHTSSRTAGAAVPRNPDSPNVLVLPPVLVAVTLAAGLLLHHFAWTVRVFPLWPARLAGAALVLAGGVLAIRAHQVMHRAGTNVIPTLPALVLVTDGPFRFTRNPLYVAATGVYLGVALWVDGLVPLLLAVPMMAILHWGVVRREERYLAAKFGEPYREYRSRVRRWF